MNADEVNNNCSVTQQSIWVSGVIVTTYGVDPQRLRFVQPLYVIDMKDSSS